MSDPDQIDREWLNSYEDKIRRLPGIEQVAIIVRDSTQLHDPGTLLVSDLIPDLPSSINFRESKEDAKFYSEEQVDRDGGTGRPAIIHGGDLREPENVPRTLSQALSRAANEAPQRGILYIGHDGLEDFQSYPQLLADAEQILAGFRRLGLRPGDKVIFQIDDNRGFISSHWACVLGGFVLVPISIAPTYQEKNLTVNKLINAWETLNYPPIITTRNLSQPLSALARREGLTEFRMATVEELIDNDRDKDWVASAPEDITILLLTSGSTGKPKLVQQCHSSLLHRSAGTVQLNRLTAEEVSVNWMPLDHVGGIVMWHLRDVFLTCQQIQVPTQMILENPILWLDIIDRCRATLTWAPNFAFGLVNERLAKDNPGHWNLSSMRSFLNGGEAVVAKTARRFLMLLAPFGLPPDSLQPAWGMSETCSGVTHSRRFSLETTSDDDHFVEVGEAIPGFSMRIVDDQNQLVPEGVIGHLQVKGTPVTSGYYRNPKANEEAFTIDGWFDTGDLGLIRDGQLAITGRGKGEIIINGINYYSHEIEAVVESIAGVDISFTAAAAVRHSNDDTDKLAVFFHPLRPEWEERMKVVREIRGKLTKAFGIYAEYVLPLEKEDIPKTAIGKIQRPLLSRQLVDGEFDDLIRKMEAESGLIDTIPNWFFRKVWIPAGLDAKGGASTNAHYLIFMDDLGLGKEVSRFLDGSGKKYIQIEKGEQFAHPEAKQFVISPGNSEHYDRMTVLLTEEGVKIGTVLHLWGYGPNRPVDDLAILREAQDRGIYSLLLLLRNLNGASITRGNPRLFVVTNHGQPVFSDGPLAYEKSALPGFLKAASLDLPWLTCRHLDFDLSEKDSDYLLKEIGCACIEGEIAYRDGVRMKPCLSSIDMLAEKPGRLPLKAGGLYLITGGLGGLGGYLAERLLTQFQAKLILIGRTKVSDLSSGHSLDSKDDRLAERIRVHKYIEAIRQKTGGEFIYYPADISNRSEVEAAVSSAESKWGLALSGIFHLAGDLHIARHWETAESHRVCSEEKDAYEAMFKAKVYGTWNLFQIIKPRPEAIFVGFSSVVSELGGATFGTYCAGNSFLDGCCYYHDHILPQDVFSFLWSMWEGLGMNKDNPPYAREAASAMGNMIIEPESGWHSLLAGLCRKDHGILVGLNGFNPHIRSRLDKSPEIPRRLDLYVTTSTGAPLTGDLRDRVKNALRDPGYACGIIKVNAIPVLEDGSIDVKSLRRQGGDAAPTGMDPVDPQTEDEKKIAAIWKEVLGVKKIRTDINFFDAGGTSIQLAQVNGRLKAVFKRHLSMTDLFQFPTISSLAGFLGSSESDTLGASLRQSADRALERRGKLLTRKRGGQKTPDQREER